MQFRKATLDDTQFLFDLRNDPAVRQNSFNQHEVARDEHIAWLTKVLADSSRYLFITLDGAQQIGQVRFDVEGSIAEISISLAGIFRGKGYGVSAIREASSYFLTSHPEIMHIVAQIKEGNAASCTAFKRAGYTFVGKKDGVFSYKFSQ